MTNLETSELTVMHFTALRARQSAVHEVLSLKATAADIVRIARIDRIARAEGGGLSGFQRTQIASHVREIEEYLSGPDAILPSPIVIAFTAGVTVYDLSDPNLPAGLCRVEVDFSAGPPGLVVDGQQRLTALLQSGRNLDVFVSVIVCADETELRRQFVLINNTRPLPKSLIYELLPGVSGGLPSRLSTRAFAADLTARLNHDRNSSLQKQIRQHTNPGGSISDTAIQRVILQSVSDGVMRNILAAKPGRAGETACFRLMSSFYRAVAAKFPQDWFGHTPKSSRLVHGAGIVALGQVMEILAEAEGARTFDQFFDGLDCLVGRTAWTSGEWHFSKGDHRHWKKLQNVSADIQTLSEHLSAIVRANIRRRRLEQDSASVPLLRSVLG